MKLFWNRDPSHIREAEAELAKAQMDHLTALKMEEYWSSISQMYEQRIERLQTYTAAMRAAQAKKEGE